MNRDWRQLVHASAAVYAREKQRLAPVLAREERLRNELARLSAHDAAARGEQASMRAIGADLAWNAWLAKARQQLNIELAQVLALKEAHHGQIRHALARLTVAEETAAAISKTRERDRAAKSLQRAVDQIVISQLLRQ